MEAVHAILQGLTSEEVASALGTDQPEELLAQYLRDSRDFEIARTSAEDLKTITFSDFFERVRSKTPAILGDEEQSDTLELAAEVFNCQELVDEVKGKLQELTPADRARIINVNQRFSHDPPFHAYTFRLGYPDDTPVLPEMVRQLNSLVRERLYAEYQGQSQPDFTAMERKLNIAISEIEISADTEAKLPATKSSKLPDVIL